MAKKLGGLISKAVKTGKLGTEQFCKSYKTGIDLMDYRGGKWEGKEKALGILGGKILYICGRTGSAKSSYAYRIAGEILRTNEEASVIHLDYERAANKARIASLAGISLSEISSESDTWTFLNSEISSESFYELVKAVSKLKKEHKSELTIEEEYNGQKVTYLPPTVILIDSLAAMIPNQYQDEKELSGQMSASAIARTNNTIFKRITDDLISANIIVIVINHITDSISMGVPTKPKFAFLKQGEDLPGGSSAVFLADSQIKLEKSSNLTEDKDYGIKGFKVDATYLKSRSNAAGYNCKLIFDQENGLDNLLTNVEFLRENKLILGSGHGYYIEGMEDKKFKLKTIREIYSNDEDFRNRFDEYMSNIYEQILSQAAKEVDEQALQIIDVEDEELGIYIGNDDKFYFLEEDGSYSEVEKLDGEWVKK